MVSEAEGTRRSVFSLNDKRAMNQGFGDGMSRAFELVATPLVFGGVGYLIDRVAGTAPMFVVTLGLFGVVGTFLRVWFGYDAEMRSLESSGAWARTDRVGDDPTNDPASIPVDQDIWSSRREVER